MQKKDGLHPCNVGLWSQLVERELCVGWHLFTLPCQTHSMLAWGKGLDYKSKSITTSVWWYSCHIHRKMIDIQQLMNKYTFVNCAQHYQTNCLGYIQLNTRLLFLPLCSKTLQPDLLNSGYWVLNLHDVSEGSCHQVYNQAANELTVQFC